MSWQLWAFLLLALAIGGGFAWYERSRPPARLVALVAALTALAVAGRLVLAPIPNVVATTDVALIAGFALGGGPGFVVGALAAPISNIWLGQGPWTAWQMAGWGLVGLGGAGLARLTGGRASRIGLAAACAVSGLAYGALLDLSVMVTYGGEQSLDRYLALSARGIPFNVAHAVGNAALALAAGPALVRMLQRFRVRFEFHWPSPGPSPGRVARRAGAVGLTAGCLAALIVLLTASAPAAEPPGPLAASSGAGSARSWLLRAQNRDGGFGAEPGASSSPAITGWTMLGLEAAGRNPLDVRRNRRSAVDFLRSVAGEEGSTGDLERTILALAGAGVDPRRFAGSDLVARLRERRSRNGAFEGQVNLTAFGILALRASGTDRGRVARSAAWLRQAQNRDGGWGYRREAGSEADSTGAALQGLAAAGAGSERALADGAAFLRRAQRGSGGFALAASGPSNAQSTAWAIQGLIAAGADPAGVRSGGRSPFDFLAARQAGDGHYRYSSSSDQTPVWVTAQTLAAVSRKAFPIDPVRRASRERGEAPAGSGSPPPAGGSGSGGGFATGAPSIGGAPSLGQGGGSPAGGAGSSGSQGSPPAASPTRTAGSDRRRERRPGDRPPAVPGEGTGTSLAEPLAQLAPGDDHATAYALGGLAALALALGAGFLWYRRRLP